MNSIKDVKVEIKNDVEATDEVLALREKIKSMSDNEVDAYFYNMSIGNLNEEDGIDCKDCNNKGIIAVVVNGFVKMRDCQCMKRRRLYQRFIETGISKEQFKRYQLSTYTIKNSWQESILSSAKEYIKEIDKNNWFYIGGISGSGKTHICTGIVSKLVNDGYEVKYFIWNTEIPSLISFRKSFYEEEQEKYKQILKKLKNAQILYIDDFLQLDVNEKEGLSIAYEIINARYSDSSKITIISSEATKEDLYSISKALCGRIQERANNGKYFISIMGDEKNYRMGNN